MCEARKDEITLSGGEVRDLCDLLDTMLVLRQAQRQLAAVGSDVGFIEPIVYRTCERMEQISQRMLDKI
jgi:hypothetical protein